MPGVRVQGVVGAAAVDVVSTKWFGGSYLQVTYREQDGRTGQAMLSRSDEPRLRLDHAGRTRAMEADPEQWRLGAEALRIRYAALFDPMLAIATSDLQPLPHQIRAVYGDMLPRTPLRFLLADDPGAGKTIMCGLYVKELMLRGDLARCLVVAPGSLVEQWQDELADKFGLQFEILTRSMVEATGPGQNVFEQHPLLIARMDQLARSDDLRAELETSDWDLVVVDEAHRMSAHYFGAELQQTRRYQLGQLLGRVTRHLLLMTATPHAGKQEDFQLFLALLDGDRFEGKFRDGVHAIRADDLMRRMVKEDLLTMEGKPLFPERRATTVPYTLSDAESELYEVVTSYVREEMGRADRLEEGDRRRNNVGFALTVLQRRLASSPEAILRSLERRRERLRTRLRAESGLVSGDELPLAERLARMVGRDVSRVDDALDDLAGDEVEALEDEVVDAATAARTRAELAAEIAVLDDLVEVARRVRVSGTDRKWSELRQILTDHALTTDTHGQHRKLIVFTEHRDTLEYLREQIAALVGDERAVVTIHGGVHREDRRKAQELFTQDRDVRVLVATDAAGEGLNLQRAHLMVNYDLPWNPNKIEQRFGRIHRIGQTEVCHLWNLVAANTREGEVYRRLLEKVEEQRAAYGGRVFDVLGDAFEDRPLRDLMIEAIRYGDRPEVRAHLDTVIDASAGAGIERLIAERALDRDHVPEAAVDEIRRQMEEAQARRLQPHYVQAFFATAFDRLGGSMRPREAGRFEITHVPVTIRDFDRQAGTGATVLTRYERVCFERDRAHRVGGVPAQLLAPGHPLLDAVVELTVMQCASALREGAVLVDANDPGEVPRLLVALNEQITDGHSRTVSKRFAFVELDPAGGVRPGGPAPYLDYRGLTSEENHLVQPLFEEEWLRRGVEDTAVAWAVENSLRSHADDVRRRVSAQVARVRREVKARLTAEINRWDAEHARLLDLEAAGRQLRMRPETAERRARDLEGRLSRRLAELDADEALVVLPPIVAGAALVVPRGLLTKLAGESPVDVAMFARQTAAVERRGMDAVMAAERALGATPEEMPVNNPGYDIRSIRTDGSVLHIEVKARVRGAETFTITKNEVVMAKNMSDDYRLALVSVGDRAEDDQLRYLTRPFDDADTGDFLTISFNESWSKAWARGGNPR